MPRRLHAMADRRVDESAAGQELAERTRPGSGVEVARHDTGERRRLHRLCHTREVHEQRLGGPAVERRVRMRGDEPEVARLPPHRGDDARKAGLTEGHHLRIDQRPPGEHGDAEVVGTGPDEPVGKLLRESLECCGPVVVDLQHGDDVGPAVAEVGDRGGGIVVDAMHVHRDHKHPLVGFSGSGRGVGCGRRQPGGHQVAGVDHGGDREAGHRGGPGPPQARGQPAESREQPVPAKVRGQVEEPVPAAEPARTAADEDGRREGIEPAAPPPGSAESRRGSGG